MAEKLQKRRAVVCTARRYRELSSLAKMRQFKLRLVGKHGGKDTGAKLRASIQRMKGLQLLVEKERPDLTISFCSPEAARISYGMGIKHIGFTDSPHATAAMKLCTPLVQKLLIPSIIPKSEFVQFGIREKNIVRYNAIDAFVTARRSVPKKQKNPFAGNKKTVLVRMEEEEAAYISKKSPSYSIIESMSKNTDAEIVVLGRYSEQIKKIKRRFGDRIKVLVKSYDGKALLMNSDLFVGSGGTMTAESALLGVPTISYNAVPNLVEEYLIKKKVVSREENPVKIARLANKILMDDKGAYLRKSRELTRQMKDPYPVLVKTMELLK